METRARSIVKCLTWQISGLVVMTVITYGLTGSIATGGAVALAGTLVGSVTYVLHERVWDRVRWGRSERRVAPFARDQA
ncbi:MAG: DUF2061 domain-containing protein [Pseudomonadota bacterium]